MEYFTRRSKARDQAERDMHDKMTPEQKVAWRENVNRIDVYRTEYYKHTGFDNDYGGPISEIAPGEPEEYIVPGSAYAKFVEAAKKRGQYMVEPGYYKADEKRLQRAREALEKYDNHNNYHNYHETKTTDGIPVVLTGFSDSHAEKLMKEIESI